MELRTLRYFLAVAQEGNITRAADILHLTQPTLSRQIMDLERELGVTLMLRGKNGLTLTDDGTFFRQRAQEIVELAASKTKLSPEFIPAAGQRQRHGRDRRIRDGRRSDAGKAHPEILRKISRSAVHPL